MKDKQFYYTNGEEKFGPFSLEKIIELDLTIDDLIWYNGLENWTKISEITDLKKHFNKKVVPPPLPERKTEKVKKDENIQPSSKELKIFLLWLSFHLFALITSYSKIDFFSDRPLSRQFWPFSEIWEQKMGLEGEAFTVFNGIFYAYDWSEFLIYVSGAILTYFIFKLSKNS